MLLGVLALAFFVAKGCQDQQVRVTEEQAVATAEKQVDFDPTYVQVRLLRQGINRQAFWFVSLSIPIGFDGDRPDLFEELSVVEIDARTGEVAKIQEQSEEDTKAAEAEAARRDQNEAVQQKLQESGGQAPR